MNPEEKKLLKRLERAKESGKLDDWEICCRRLAELHVSYGRYEEALKAYQKELSVCELKGNAAGIATAHRMVGEMYNTLGQFSESLEHINKYLDFARKSRDSVEEQRALATIGRTYFCWASELKASDSMQDAAKAASILKECRKAYMKSLYICEQPLKNTTVRERQEMKARILFNLGLACEIEEDLFTALEFVAKSIAICKQENLLEDLHRCYISQSTILLKRTETKLALAAIDQACELSKKLPNATESLVLALLHKSEVYFAMSNYAGARSVLKKAYKAKSPNEEDRISVETSLKRAVLLCDLEEKLSKTDENSLIDRKSLYEKLGDACCLVKNFKHAIQCYKNMMDCALRLGQSGKDLQPCYVSLYQTYRDDKDYVRALEFATKEFELSKNVPAEAAKSHLVIAELHELKKSDYQAIAEKYSEVRRLAKNAGERPLESIALKRLLALQRAEGRDDAAVETERQLQQLGVIDSEDSQSDNEPSPTDGVHLSDLSDSDEEVSRARSARNTFRVTRNEKGETPLHTAAIKGDVSRAQRLISLGHPVRERDLCGWTPLHEAANHGHVDMVNCLLKAGADVNDPGGRDCGGVTPLHDAASNGHFDVITALLQSNASVTVLTDSGETPLDCIKAWKERVDCEEPLSQADVETYEKIVTELEAKLRAVGYNANANNKAAKEKQRRSREDRLMAQNKRDRHPRSPKGKTVANLRRDSDCAESRRRQWGSVSPERLPPSITLTDDPESHSPEIQESPVKNRQPVADYRAAIEALRKRPTVADVSKPSHAEKQPSLLEESSYIDEWLEDDLRQNRAQKRRKISDYAERTAIRRSDDTNSRRDSDDFPDFFFPLDDPVDFPAADNVCDKQTRKKPKLQTTLSSAGFYATPRQPTSASALQEADERPCTPPQLDTSVDFPSLPSPPFSSVSDHQALTKVRVHVGQMTLLIPVDTSKVSELTVRWLAEETARRYAELEGVEPQLQLRTRDGAMIASTDPVSVTLGEDIESVIVGWKTASLTERYEKAVLQAQEQATPLSGYGLSNPGPDLDLMERLAACDLSKWLDMKYMALTVTELTPVMRALRHEKSLQMLNMAGNILGDDGLEVLMSSLEHCSLQQLDLSCNNITSAGLTNFANSLDTMSKEFLTALTSIDVSFNPIGNISENLKEKVHAKLPNLKQFKTDYCESPI